ncbi:MAG: hypothetical protein M3406_16325 [Chloroflexota bacterium]|nr:hypothetical protein [Chloroflexota bacterium]
MEWIGLISGPLLVAAAMVVVSRFYDLMRVDDPFVYSFAFISIFWIAGMGLAPYIPGALEIETPTKLLLAVGYVSFVAGGVIGTRLPRGSEWSRRYDRIQPQRGLSSLELGLLGGTLIVGLLSILLLVALVGGIPVLMPDAEQARVDERAGLGYLFISAIWLMALPTVALVSHARIRGSGSWILAATLVAVVATVAMAVIGNRGPPIIMLIGAAFVAVVACGALPRWRTLVLIGGAALVVLAVTVVLRTGEDLTLAAVWNRIEWQMYVNPSNFQRLVDFIPEQVGYLLGYGYLIDLAVLLPGPQINFSTWLKEAMGLEFAGGGITISLLGELYANWGPVIAVIAPAVVAIGLSMVRGVLSVRTPLDGAFVILLSLSLGGIMQSGIVSPLLYSVLPLTGLYVVLRVAGGQLAARPWLAPQARSVGRDS